MNYSKHMSTSVSALLVAVLAIMAFIRRELQIWLLGAAFLLWAMWALTPLLQAANRKHAYLKSAYPAATWDWCEKVPNALFSRAALPVLNCLMSQILTMPVSFLITGQISAVT